MLFIVSGRIVGRSARGPPPGEGQEGAVILAAQTVGNLTGPARRGAILHAMRVLIVEDDKVLAHGLTETLRRSGYVVDAVPTAEQAEAALRVTEIDLVILDIGLPGMDGFTWLKRRSEEHTSELQSHV